MKPSPKFNHRRKFERQRPAATVAPTFPANPNFGGGVDSDFDELGVASHPDFAAAPDVIVHLGFEHGATCPVIERIHPRVGAE